MTCEQFNNYFERETENLKRYIKTKNYKQFTPYYVDDVFQDTYLKMYDTFFNPKYKVKNEKTLDDERMKVYFTLAYYTNRLNYAIEEQRFISFTVEPAVVGDVEDVEGGKSTAEERCLKQAEDMFGIIPVMLLTTYFNTPRCTYKKLADITGIKITHVKKYMMEIKKYVGLCLKKLKYANE